MFRDIGSLLPKSIKRAGLARQIKAAQVLKIYEEIVRQYLPDSLASKLKPLYVRDKTLTVASLSSVIAQEMRFKERELLEKINGALGAEVIEKIRYAA